MLCGPHALLRGGRSGLAHAHILGVALGPKIRELRHAIGVRGGEVALLAAVGGEVVELPRTVLTGRDQLPVSGADGAIVVVVEVEEVARGGAVLLERRRDAAAGKRRAAF